MQPSLKLSGRVTCVKLTQMQIAISSFCVFHSDSVHKSLSDTHSSFHDDGEQEEDTYTKGSIYAILYSLYELMGKQTFDGVDYQFTFNTWGISPNVDMRLERWDDKDPQRHGRAACEQNFCALLRALVTDELCLSCTVPLL